jgi:hypothetical protein
MRKLLGVMAAIAVGMAVLACNRPPEPQQQAFASPPPPASYGSGGYGGESRPPETLPQTYSNAPYGRADVPPQYPAPPSYGRDPIDRADFPDDDQRLVWKPSPRWATVKSNAKSVGDTGEIRRPRADKLKLAQAKAARVGVENLSGEDIEGLSTAELKELRGY